MHVLRRLADMQSRLAGLERLVAQGVPSSAVLAEAPGSQAAVQGANHPAQPSATVLDIIGFAVLPIVLLFLGHHLVVFTLDLSPVWLLMLTLLLPIPFGYLAISRTHRGLVFWAIIYLASALIAVFAMNVGTFWSTYDPNSGATLWPGNRDEWLQNGEFAAGMFLSFATGMFASLIALRIRHPSHPKLATTREGLQTLARHFRIALSMETIERAGKYASSVGALGSAIGALYLGLQRL